MKAIAKSTADPKESKFAPKKTPKEAIPNSRVDGLVSPTDTMVTKRGHGRPAKATATVVVKEDQEEDEEGKDENMEDEEA